MMLILKEISSDISYYEFVDREFMCTIQSIISNYHNSQDLVYQNHEFDEYTTRPQFTIIEPGVKKSLRI